MTVSNYSVEKINEADWLSFASKCHLYNYRQSWHFGILAATRLGARCEHVAIREQGGSVVGIADVRIKSLPIVGGGLAYISGGPLLLGCHESNAYNFIVSSLIDEYVIKRSLNLRIMPSPQPEDQLDIVNDDLMSLGFSDKSESKQTIFLDLSPSLEDIRKKFHQKWRNCLNKGEKGSVIFTSGTDSTFFEKFRPLLEKLIIEKNFSVDLDLDFYMDVQVRAADQDKFQVTLAEVDGVTVAGHVASLLGDTGVYLLGATNDMARIVNAAYLLQWQAIVQSKAAGCRWYDLGGIDPVGNPGVYRFKKRMGGGEIVMPGPFELKATGWRAGMTSAGERMYKTVKSFRSKFGQIRKI